MREQWEGRHAASLETEEILRNAARIRASDYHGSRALVVKRFELGKVTNWLVSLRDLPGVRFWLAGLAIFSKWGVV